MATKTIDVNKDKAQLNDLLSLALQGTEVILAKDNTPLARLVLFNKPSSQPRIAGLHQNAIWMSDDFDAPLPDAFWLGIE